MITQMKVNGFKSLKDFNIKLNKGINVLVGPNGSGKSNICQAFGLLAAVANNNLSDYILKVGGSSGIFSDIPKMGMDKKIAERKIDVSCIGEMYTKYTAKNHSEMMASLRYTYKVSIVRSKDILTIQNERFALLRENSDGKFIQLITASRGKKSKEFTEIKLKIKNPDLLGPVRMKEFKTLTKAEITLDPLQSMVPFLGIISLFSSAFVEDLRHHIYWNIDPVISKKSNDISEMSEMSSNGRRLSNSIYTLMKESKSQIDEINSFLKQIIPNFSNLNTESVEDGTRRSYSISFSNGLKIKAASLSDGTVKLIAVLVSMIQKQYSTYILEEPENYVHPWASQLLIGYIRDTFEEGVCLLTTHSETILNSVNPEEILIIESLECWTQISRIKKLSSIKKIISETGFGSGYHYVGGSLSAAPKVD